MVCPSSVKTLSMICSYVVFTLFSGCARADCIIATDTPAQIGAAGYEWQFVAELLKVAQDPSTSQKDIGDLYTANRSYAGVLDLPTLDLSIRAVVPRKKAASTSPIEAFHLQNGKTLEADSGKQIYSTYRIVFWVDLTGPGMKSNQRGVRFLMKDVGECSLSRDAIGFTADQVIYVAAERLVKL